MENCRENDNTNEKIQKIMRQTNYSEEIVKEKLKEYNYDEVSVIKNYLGIVEKKQPIKSVNQEIYKQMRQKLVTQTGYSLHPTENK
jgi:DNA-binding LacI/PurR family transcriptional regulator